MAGDSKETLIDSGIELLLELRWQDLQGVASTRAITDRAGVTTGSFFHHFRNRAHYAEALVERFQALWAENEARLLVDLDNEAVPRGAAGVRATAEADWSAIDGESITGTFQHLLWVAREQPLTEESSTTAGFVLRDAYRSLTDTLMPSYCRVLAAMNREMMPPFEVLDIVVALTAIADGLQMRRGVDEDSVRDRLYADLVTALFVAVTRPVGEQAEPRELGTLEIQLGTPQVPSVPPADGTETWRQIADAAAPLFVGRLISEVRVAEVAEAAGVSTSTVYHHFGTVSAVAAAGWARHFPELEAISTRPLTPAEGPIVRIEQVLARVVELAKENRGATEGFILEVLAESGPEPPRHRPRRIRTSIPMTSLLVPHVRELRTRGLLRRRIDSQSLARSMLQLVTMRVLMSVNEPVERIIDDTVGMLLEGALVGTAR